MTRWHFAVIILHSVNDRASRAPRICTTRSADALMYVCACVCVCRFHDIIILMIIRVSDGWTNDAVESRAGGGGVRSMKSVVLLPMPIIRTAYLQLNCRRQSADRHVCRRQVLTNRYRVQAGLARSYRYRDAYERRNVVRSKACGTKRWSKAICNRFLLDGNWSGFILYRKKESFCSLNLALTSRPLNAFYIISISCAEYMMGRKQPQAEQEGRCELTATRTRSRAHKVSLLFKRCSLESANHFAYWHRGRI